MFLVGTWQGSCSKHLENLTQLVLSPHLIPDRLCWSCNVRIRTHAGILLLLHRFALVQCRVCGQLCTPLFLWWSCTLSPRGKVTYSHSNSYSCLFCCWSIGQQWGRAGMKRVNNNRKCPLQPLRYFVNKNGFYTFSFCCCCFFKIQ